MGLGFKQAGFTIAGAWDFDKYAVQSYKENVGDHVQQADIRDMSWADVPKADVWTFGFPCQDLSTAGKRAGLQIECFDCGWSWAILPGEYNSENNCPNCNSTRHKSANRSGLFFEVMRLLEETEQNAPDNLPKVILAENVKGLQPYLPVLEEEYAKRGYVMKYDLLNSKFFGVPQNRERYFVVGLRRDLADREFTCPKPSQSVPKLSTILEADVPEKYYLSDEKAQKIIAQALKRLEKLGKVHAALTPDRVEKRQNGRRAKEEEEPMFTLTAQDLHGVIQSVWATDDGTVQGGHRQPKILVEAVAEAVKEIAQKKRPNDEISVKILPNGDIRPHRVDTRKSGLSEINTVVYEENVAPTCISSHVNSIYGQATHYRVRKLTPREYARLQGFPDDYKKVVSDTQFYKQMGNAVTVTVAGAIAENIKSFLLNLGG